jgi:hypothetical protein
MNKRSDSTVTFGHYQIDTTGKRQIILLHQMVVEVQAKKIISPPLMAKSPCIK